MNHLSKRLANRIGIAAVSALLIGVMPMEAMAVEFDLHAGVAAAIIAEENTPDETDLSAGVAVDIAIAHEEVLAMVEDADEVEAEETEEVEEVEEVEEKADVIMANVKDSVNVRLEPSEDAEAVGKLYKNCGGVMLEQKDGWTKISSGKLEGWAKDEFLLFGEEALELQQEVGCLKATVKTDALRVRKEASEDAGVYMLAENGQELIAEEELGDWVSVKIDDTICYVASEFVDVAFSVDTGKTMDEIQAEEKKKEKEKLSKNRGAVSVEVSDVTLLAALIQCEAGKESAEGKLAVGAVVMNRVRSGSYPNSVSGVIYQSSQFGPAGNGKVAAVIASGPSASCVEAAQSAIGGASNVGGATHFRRAGSDPGVVIGNHVFW